MFSMVKIQVFRIFWVFVFLQGGSGVRHGPVGVPPLVPRGSNVLDGTLLEEEGQLRTTQACCEKSQQSGFTKDLATQMRI
jgi:hypothetical protein